MAIVEADTAARQGTGHHDAVQPGPTWTLSPAWVILGMISTAVAIALTVMAIGPHQLDFAVYRMGGFNVFGQHLYTTRVTSRGLLFTYPPFAALLLWPIGHLSAHAGQIGWNLLNCAALLALIGVSIKLAKGVRVNRRVWVSALVFMLPALLLNPVRLTTVLGEVNLFIALMVLVDLTCVVGLRTHILPRGTLLGVAAAIKLTPLIFVPFLFLTRQFRAGFVALASFSLCTLGSFALAPRSSWLYWTKEMFDTHRVGNSWFVGNQNLRGALERLTGTPPSSVLLFLLTLLFAVGGLAVAVRAYRRSSPLLGILLCAATGLIISPISWSDHYVWIVPVLAWLIFGADRPRGGRWWAFGAAVLFVWAPMYGLPHYLHHFSGPLQYVQGNAFLLAVVAFLALTAVMVWRRDEMGSARPLDAHTGRASH
jgi:alpha-1,2-mannosyltransferase